MRKYITTGEILCFFNNAKLYYSTFTILKPHNQIKLSDDTRDKAWRNETIAFVLI